MRLFTQPLGVWGACRTAVPALVLLFAAGAASAQEDASLALQQGTASNPHTLPQDIAAGERFFNASCVICHGAGAKGGRGPDLTRGVFHHGSSDAELFRNVRNGIPGTDMVGIYRPDTDIWQVVAYLRSLSAQAEVEEVPGDPRQGARLYQTRGGCPACHRLNGSGGRLGPDLSDIGYRRSPEVLEASLARPGEELNPRYRTVRLVTKDGTEVRGVLRNEDSYSIQLLDEGENLRAFLKADLESVDKPQESLMPSFATFFSDRELQDLVAYLYSLKGEQH